MSRVQRTNTSPKSQNGRTAPPTNSADDRSATPTSPTEQRLQRAQTQAALGHYQKAIETLGAAGEQNDALRNIKGVCLLRLGKFEDAVNVYRGFVLDPASLWLRTDLPKHYKTNYATALLLAGKPHECLEILYDTHDEQDATVQRLRAAIKRWEKGLPLLRRLDWWLGRVAPRNRPITIDFEPGDFGVLPTTPDTGMSSPSSPHLHTGA